MINEKKADVNAVNSLKNTPLHLATENKCVDCIDLLIGKGANVNAKNSDGETPLHHAVFYANYDCMEKLISTNRAEVNAKNSDGETPLHLTTRSCLPNSLKLLIENGGQVKECNGHQQGPLHLAFKNACISIDFLNKSGKGSKEYVEYITELIAAGTNAEINAKDRDKSTPLHEAFKCGLPEETKQKCCKLLISAGADETAQDVDCKIPSDYKIYSSQLSLDNDSDGRGALNTNLKFVSKFKNTFLNSTINMV